jgi:hypothetical protein
MLHHTYACVLVLVLPRWYDTGGYVRIYLKFTIFFFFTYATHALRASREGRWDESTMSNSGSKLKIRLVGPLGNLLLFPSMGRGTRESKYPHRKVVYNSCTI